MMASYGRPIVLSGSETSNTNNGKLRNRNQNVGLTRVKRTAQTGMSFTFSGISFTSKALASPLDGCVARLRLDYHLPREAVSSEKRYSTTSPNPMVIVGFV